MIGYPLLIITSFYILRPPRMMSSVFLAARIASSGMRLQYPRAQLNVRRINVLYHRRLPGSPRKRREWQGRNDSDDDRVDSIEKKAEECALPARSMTRVHWYRLISHVGCKVLAR